MKKILLITSVVLISLSALAQRYQRPMMMQSKNKVGGQRAGNCSEQLGYYKTFSDIYSGYGGGSNWAAAIYVDQEEMAFYHDTSSFQGVNFYASQLIDGVNKGFDSIYVEVYIGSTITGVDMDNTIDFGTLIYSKNVTSTFAEAAQTNYSFDSLIPMNKDTAYTFAIRFTGGKKPCMGIDNGPQKAGKGGWTEFGGSTSQRIDDGSSGENWMIDICIDGSTVIPAHNLTMDVPRTSLDGYQIMHIKQSLAKGYYMSTKVKNNGTSTATGVTADYTISPVNKKESVSVGTINSTQTKSVQFVEEFSPFAPGEYSIEFNVVMDSNDFYKGDNKAKAEPFFIDQYRYGRVERGYIGRQPLPYSDILYGNVMDMFTEDTLKYIEVHLYEPVEGAEMRGFCVPWDSAGVNVFGDTIYTDYFTVDADLAAAGDTIITLPFLKHHRLDVGKYLFGVIETDGDTPLGIATSTRNYSPGTCYLTATFGGSPLGEWFEQDYYFPFVMVTKNIYNTGVRDLVSDYGLKVFPNPARDMLNIEIDVKFTAKTIEVVDVLGNTVLSNAVNPNTKNITISTVQLAKGFYFVKVSGEMENLVKKIIIE